MAENVKELLFPFIEADIRRGFQDVDFQITPSQHHQLREVPDEMPVITFEVKY